MKEDFVFIHVDVHEQDSEVAQVISARDMGVVSSEHLETGDVVLRYNCYTVGIELKRGADFDHSLKTGRLHDQIARCTEEYDFPILIVEGWKPWMTDDDDDHSIAEKVRKHEMTIRTLNRRVTTYETKDMRETLEILEELVRDLKMRKLNVLRRPVILREGLSDAMNIICSLPTIKETLAERILDEYETPCNALGINLESLDRWMEIEGIGKKKLANIKAALESKEIFE